MARLAMGSDDSTRTLVCKICGTTFLESQRLAAEAHVRTAHPEVFKPLGCMVCGEEFSASEALVGHLQQRHPQEFANLLRELSAPRE